MKYQHQSGLTFVTVVSDELCRERNGGKLNMKNKCGDLYCFPARCDNVLAPEGFVHSSRLFVALGAEQATLLKNTAQNH